MDGRKRVGPTSCCWHISVWLVQELCRITEMKEAIRKDYSFGKGIFMSSEKPRITSLNTERQPHKFLLIGNIGGPLPLN